MPDNRIEPTIYCSPDGEVQVECADDWLDNLAPGTFRVPVASILRAKQNSVN